MSPPTVARDAPSLAPVERRRRPAVTRALTLRALIAAAAGLLAFLAFPPVGAWWAAPLAVAALVLVVRDRRPRAAFGLGTAFGVALFVPLLIWIDTLGVDVWLGLAVAEALFVGALGAAVAVLQRLPGWPAWVAAAWVADEAVRSRVPLGGFPWGRLAFAQADGPLVRYAALGGAPLTSFVVALAGALLAAAALAVVHRSARLAAGAALAAAGVVAVAPAIPLPSAGQSAGGPALAVVAVVQGNVPRIGLDAFAQRYAVVRNHAATAEALAADVRAGRRPRPDVVLWPENSSDIDPGRDPYVGALLAQAVASTGVPNLVGAVIDGPGPRQVRNAGLVWLPGQQPVLGYVKRHLVPFGEYVPYRAELGSLIGRLRRVPYDFVPGRGSDTVQLGAVRLSDVICYEVAYDGLVRGDVRRGGRLIVVQTNNATYGYSETRQQLAMGRLRAVEHGRSVAVAATSGISALIAPDGSVLARSEVFTRAALERRLPLRDTITVADHLGAWPELGLSALGAVATGVAVAAAIAAATARRRGRPE
ncbi:MAG: apolipoprotein N-acyltransferase [Frankiaceae bacterium]